MTNLEKKVNSLNVTVNLVVQSNNSTDEVGDEAMVANGSKVLLAHY